ncbi:MAG TPA: MmcQ/YjbR family DNA-binding protein [Candidatus Limnocylindria bacterium]|nr:MmcQ/YjbR family DNA-binding protein [Candidatus Limnocylindria bacterium]
MTDPEAIRVRLREYALGLPEAWEDHPWGETVAKVRKKVFVFLGSDGSAEPRIWVKLAESQPLALSQPGVSPAGYNLGKSGWVDVRLSDETPYEMLREWIDESYRAVAPRSLERQLGVR